MIDVHTGNTSALESTSVSRICEWDESEALQRNRYWGQWVCNLCCSIQGAITDNYLICHSTFILTQEYTQLDMTSSFQKLFQWTQMFWKRRHTLTFPQTRFQPLLSTMFQPETGNIRKHQPLNSLSSQFVIVTQTQCVSLLLCVGTWQGSVLHEGSSPAAAPDSSSTEAPGWL